MEEFTFIDWIRSQTALDPASVPVGPGDDCAVVRFGGDLLLVTTDQCADGVHFILADCGAEAAGYKVMARSLSDIAAMGGEPVAAVATVAVAAGMTDADGKAIYHGLRRAGDAFGCPIVGGDVAAWANPVLLTVTMWGRPVAAPILRSTARPGDVVCVTGALGGSLASGRHLSFTPRLAEARTLVERYAPTAMIDISDGLAADLHHICRESGVHVNLAAATIPISPTAAATPDPLAAALSDGEDYELLFTLAPQDADRLLADQPFDVPVTRIGIVTEGAGATIEMADGATLPLQPRGFRHRT